MLGTPLQYLIISSNIRAYSPCASRIKGIHIYLVKSMLGYLNLYRFRFCLRTVAILKAPAIVRLRAEFIIMLMGQPKNNSTVIMISHINTK